MKNIIVIGVSTGGPRTLVELFTNLPVLNASVIIVQHILAGVDKRFSERLDDRALMTVRLAEHGDVLEHGTAYMAPSMVHTHVVSNDKLHLIPGPKVNFCCPAVDVTMQSLAKNRTGCLVGVVLTGMGKDGSAGIVHIKGLGGYTIAQDEKTSVIYGMPKAAVETGKVDHVLPLEKIGAKLVELVGERL